jgi:hypothetical protein
MSMKSEWEAMKPAVRKRIHLVAVERQLSADEIASAITCRDDDLLQFAERHALSLDWLICGCLEGRLRMARWYRSGRTVQSTQG